MADRGLTTSIPIWVRVSGIITLVLVGVVVSSMLLGGIGASDHEGGRMMEGMDHNRGQTRPAAQSESEPAENPAPSCDQTPPQEGRPSDGPDDPTATPGPDDPTPTPTPSHDSGDHTRSDGSRGH